MKRGKGGRAEAGFARQGAFGERLLLRRRLLAAIRDAGAAGERQQQLSSDRRRPKIRWSALACGAATAQLAESICSEPARWGLRAFSVLLFTLLVPMRRGNERGCDPRRSGARLGTALALAISFGALQRRSFPEEEALRLMALAQDAPHLSFVPLRSANARAERARPRNTGLDMTGIVEGSLRFPFRGEVALTVRVDLGDGVTARLRAAAPDLPWHPLAGADEGDRIRFSGNVRLLAPSRDEPPFPFSFAASLFRKGIAATTQLGMRVEVEQKERCGTSCGPPEPAARFSAQLAGATGAREGIGVLLAGAAGREELLSRRTEELFRATGLSHLLVVSGYHVAVIFGLLRAITGRVCGRWAHRIRVELPATVIAFGGTLAYGYAVGMEPTISRAMCGLALLVGARLLCRAARPPAVQRWRVLAAVFVLNLVLFPGSIFEPGSELTFGALVGLTAATLILEDRRLDARELRAPFAEQALGYLLGNVLAFLGTLPVVLTWFGTFAPATVLFNVLYGALFTLLVIVAGGVLLLAEWLVPGMCTVPLDLLAAAVELMLGSIEYLARLEWLASSGGLTPQLDGGARVAAVALVAALYLALFALIRASRGAGAVPSPGAASCSAALPPPAVDAEPG